MPMFSIEHHRHGTIVARFDVPASASPFVGVRWEDWNMQPNVNATVFRAPYRIKAAVRRAARWWQDKLCNDVVTMPLTDTRGNPMGTLIARLNPST